MCRKVHRAKAHWRRAFCIPAVGYLKKGLVMAIAIALGSWTLKDTGAVFFVLSILIFIAFIAEFTDLVGDMRSWEKKTRSNHWTHEEALERAPINLVTLPDKLSNIYKYMWLWVIALVIGLILR